MDPGVSEVGALTTQVLGEFFVIATVAQIAKALGVAIEELIK